MAGWQCGWKTIVWFGGRKPLNGKGVIPCLAAKGIDEQYEFTLHVPMIQPVSERLFHTICHEIRKRFSDKVGHLNELSWTILLSEKDLPFRYGVYTHVPVKNQTLGECEILTER
ncbi:MAG: hypothetical protein FWC50_01535 [Planctomycetaceae bacterium]|nr:hypothetical protein [Planctomycetaceae bacterium]